MVSQFLILLTKYYVIDMFTVLYFFTQKPKFTLRRAICCKEGHFLKLPISSKHYGPKLSFMILWPQEPGMVAYSNVYGISRGEIVLCQSPDSLL